MNWGMGRAMLLRKSCKIRLHGIKEIKILPILMWCEFIDSVLGAISGSEKERNCVIVLMGGGPKSFLKLMHDWSCFREYSLFYVGPQENFSVVVTVACKYLLFITVCLENGIKKKPLFSFWLSHDLDFPLQFNQKSDWDFRNEPSRGNT